MKNKCDHIFIGWDKRCRLCGIYFPERDDEVEDEE